MTRLPGLTPLHVAHRARPADDPLAIAYGYFLVDLTGVSQEDEEAFAESAGSIHAEVSDEVTWRMELRSNGAGFLVDASAFQVQIPTREELDALPPVLVPFGLELNLWWTRESSLHRQARGGGGDVTREAQLAKVSTFFDSRRDARAIYQVLHPDLRRGWEARADEALWRDRSVHVYPRAKVALRARGDAVFGSLELVDDALRHALTLAGRILGLLRVMDAHDVATHAAFLRRVEEVLERAEHPERLSTLDQARTSLNTTLELLERRRGEYRSTLRQLDGVPRDLQRAIERVGEVLARLLPAAYGQARWHQGRAGQRRMATILEALGHALSDTLHERLVASDQVSAEDRAVLEGQPPDPADPVQGFLGACKGFADWAGKGSDLTAKATGWVEQVLHAAAARAPTQIVARLERVHWLMSFYEEDGFEQVTFTASRVRIEVELQPGQMLRTLAQRLEAGGRQLERLTKALKVVNCLFALRDARADDSLRNWVNAGHTAAEVLALSDRLKSRVCATFGISTRAFSTAVGLGGVVISIMDGAEAWAEGNRVALMGHMIAASGGYLALAAESGPGAVVAAVLVVGGAVVVAFSATDDEAWVLQQFNQPSEFDVTNTRGDAARRALRRIDRELRSLGTTGAAERYLERQGL